MRWDGQRVGQRNLNEPEAEEIHDGRGDGVACAVEGLQHDHAVGVADVAVADDAQARRGQRDDLRVLGEEAHDGLGEDDEEDADAAEEKHVVEAGAPDRFFGAFGLFGAEVLADEGGGGVAESPGRQKDEDDDADGDGVAGECGGAEDADDADQADPAGVGDGELQDAGERDAEQAQQGRQDSGESGCAGCGCVRCRGAGGKTGRGRRCCGR